MCHVAVSHLSPSLTECDPFFPPFLLAKGVFNSQVIPFYKEPRHVWIWPDVLQQTASLWGQLQCVLPPLKPPRPVLRSDGKGDVPSFLYAGSARGSLTFEGAWSWGSRGENIKHIDKVFPLQLPHLRETSTGGADGSWQKVFSSWKLANGAERESEMRGAWTSIQSRSSHVASII